MQEKRSKWKSSRTDKHVPFDKREITKIVGMIESGVPRREVLSQYGMHHSTLTYWMNRHGSSAYRDGRPRPYGPSEKRSILRAVESGMGVRQACVAFGVKSRSTVDRWLRLERGGIPGNNAELSIQTPVMQPKEEQAADERKALEQQLAEAQLKIRALETMIDIAEEQLKIDIRKSLVPNSLQNETGLPSIGDKNTVRTVWQNAPRLVRLPMAFPGYGLEGRHRPPARARYPQVIAPDRHPEITPYGRSHAGRARHQPGP